MTTTQPMFRQDDIVGIDHPDYAGQRWQIVTRNRTTYTCKPENDPGARGLRVPGYMLTTPPKPGECFSVLDTRPKGLRTGAVVTYSRPLRGTDTGPGKYFVVVKDKLDKAHIVPLGGNDNGSYWPVAVAYLTVINPADILKG